MNKSTAKKITVCVWVVLAIIALFILQFVAEFIEYQNGLKKLEQCCFQDVFIFTDLGEKAKTDILPAQT